MSIRYPRPSKAILFNLFYLPYPHLHPPLTSPLRPSRRKFHYNKHMEHLIRSRPLVDDLCPSMFQQLPQAQFFGVGPKKSLDQKIDFINENNHLARRIIQIGNRKDFKMSAGVDLPLPGRGYSSTFDIIGNINTPSKRYQQQSSQQPISRMSASS